MAYRYYSLLRPIGPGTFPGRPIEIKNFDERIWVEAVKHEAWGWLEYLEPLTEADANNYDLKMEEKEMTNYYDMKVVDLRKIACKMKIKGYKSAGKSFLVPAIMKVEAERKAAEEAAKKKKPGKEAQKFEGKTLQEWSEELNIPVATLRGRMRRGWKVEEALNADSHKARKEKLYEFNGKKQNLRAWGEELGISHHTLTGRLTRLGWSVEKAFTTKANERKKEE